MSNKELSKMRSKFENLNTDNLIDDILQKSENLTKTIAKSSTAIEFLEELRTTAFKEFTENMVKMDRKDIVKDFEKRLIKFNSDAAVFLQQGAHCRIDLQTRLLVARRAVQLQSRSALG